jgi:hypothetical protein
MLKICCLSSSDAEMPKLDLSLGPRQGPRPVECAAVLVLVDEPQKFIS